MALPVSQHIVTLPRFDGGSSLAEKSPPKLDLVDIVFEWLSSFAGIFESKDLQKLPTLFEDEAWWRDHLALSGTLSGLDQIVS